MTNLTSKTFSRLIYANLSCREGISYCLVVLVSIFGQQITLISQQMRQLITYMGRIIEITDHSGPNNKSERIITKGVSYYNKIRYVAILQILATY